MIRYRLPGSLETQQALYPDPTRLDPATRERDGLHTTEAVIAHFTASSLRQDGIGTVAGSLHVDRDEQGYTVSFSPLEPSREAAAQFAHQARSLAAVVDLDHTHALDRGHRHGLGQGGLSGTVDAARRRELGAARGQQRAGQQHGGQRAVQQ